MSDGWSTTEPQLTVVIVVWYINAIRVNMWEQNVIQVQGSEQTFRNLFSKSKKEGLKCCASQKCTLPRAYVRFVWKTVCVFQINSYQQLVSTATQLTSTYYDNLNDMFF